MMINGVLNIDKPKGLTSHDVVDMVRRAARQKKVGHTGTLDPIATGVLPVCLGRATKLAEYLTAEQKGYRMVCRLGLVTDTQDITGEILSENEVGQVDQTEFEAILEKFRGEIMQVPPMVSAKRHQGKRLYELAREGIEIERDPIPVQVHRLDLIDFRLPEVELDVVCSKGTYVRTLCHDIGKQVGCGGAMAELVRTFSGTFRVENAIDIALLKDPETVMEHLISPDLALQHFPAVVLADSAVRVWMTGQGVRGSGVLSCTDTFPKNQTVRIKSTDDRLLGLATAVFDSRHLGRLGGDLEVFRTIRVFPEPFTA